MKIYNITLSHAESMKIHNNACHFAFKRGEIPGETTLVISYVNTWAK
jgi:hypothetical protein